MPKNRWKQDPDPYFTGELLQYSPDLCLSDRGNEIPNGPHIFIYALGYRPIYRSFICYKFCEHDILKKRMNRF